MESLHIGDTITDEKHPVKVEGLKYPTPMVSFAVEPKKRGDEQKIGTAMSKLTDEDPSFQVRRDGQTKEMVMSGVSNLQLDIFMHRIKRRYDVELVTHPPRIPYLETITATGDARYRHRKQTGGAGQFAEVALKNFSRNPGTKLYDNMVDGTDTYKVSLIQKPLAAKA